MPGSPTLTALLDGLIRPVLTVPVVVAHLVPGDTFATVALELVGPIALCHVDAAELITHILAVMLLVALAAAVNAGAVCTLELIRPARRCHWRAQGDGHEKHQSENVLC